MNHSVAKKKKHPILISAFCLELGLYYDTDISGCLGNIFKATLIYPTNGNHTRVWFWNFQRRNNGEKHPNICENYSLINVKGFLKSYGMELFNNMYSRWISELT